MALSACRKSVNINEQTFGTDAEVVDIRAIKVPVGFDWSTTKSYQISISLKSPNDRPLEKAEILFSADTRSNNGRVIVKGLTNTEGNLLATLEVPSYFDKVILNTDQLSIPQNILIYLNKPFIQMNLGGSNPDIVETVTGNSPVYTSLDNNDREGEDERGDKDEGAEEEIKNEDDNPKSKSEVQESEKFISASNRTWNNDGLPNYLEEDDNISVDFFNQINKQLPDKRISPTNTYLSSSCSKLITMKQDADVYVSLIGESTNNKNALLYYTYHKNNPPASVNDISKLNIVFPNMSLSGSGGAMKSSHRVKLGNFKAGTVIAYCIATNGWKGGNEGYKGITKGKHIIYSNQDFNPENDDQKRQHVVSFCDAGKKKFIMGFEDTRRDYGSDEDFNDAVICTSSIPSNAIEDNNSCPVSSQNDTDGDGIADESDDYPNDKNKTFNNKTAVGTVSFEDNWPYTGDYDLNDLVIDYSYNVITNSFNQVVRVEGTLILRATGGAYRNGFGIQFPIEANKVNGVTGAQLEAGQSKAVLILFDNMRAQMNDWNTFQNSTGTVKEYNIAFNVSNGPTMNSFGLGCYNPFIWNGSLGRAYEIHLPNHAPTDLADMSQFGLAEDASNLNEGKTYVSKVNNLPWAIHTPELFVYPVEKTPIVQGHKKFANWVKSGGMTFPDWYTNQEGYRDCKKLYQNK